MNYIDYIERNIYDCPELNCEDTFTYPEVSNETFLMMETEFFEDSSISKIFPFVRNLEASQSPEKEETSNAVIIDIYVWDITLYPKYYRRFIIREGYRMTGADEALFLECIGSNNICVPRPFMNYLYTNIKRSFPQWDYINYYHDPDGINRSLRHLYFASHPSAREILYKAGRLENVAFHLDEIADNNLIGTTPGSIVGQLPIKLLRILNSEGLVIKLYSSDSLEHSRRVYESYGSYIGNEFPRPVQWAYLEALYDNNGTFGGYGFIRRLYNKLADAWNQNILRCYEKFLEFRKRNPDMDTYMKKMRIPGPTEVMGIVSELEMLVEYSENEILKQRFALRKELGDYEYMGQFYSVLMPGTPFELCSEAIAQKNCLMSYVKVHGEGDSTILFIRKNQDLKSTYVTMEVECNEITQVFGVGNTYPPKAVYEFLLEYGKAKGIKCNPYHLICGNEDYDLGDVDEELIDFAVEFINEAS